MLSNTLPPPLPLPPPRPDETRRQQHYRMLVLKKKKRQRCLQQQLTTTAYWIVCTIMAYCCCFHSLSTTLSFSLGIPPCRKRIVDRRRSNSKNPATTTRRIRQGRRFDSRNYISSAVETTLPSSVVDVDDPSLSPDNVEEIPAGAVPAVNNGAQQPVVTVSNINITDGSNSTTNPTKTSSSSSSSLYTSGKVMLDANQVKASVDIVSVIESYNLQQFQRKSTTRATACCPFHKDNSPSLSIDGSSRQRWKCFGCGVGGDVFAFVRKYHALETSNNGSGGAEMSFSKALRYVHDTWGTGDGTTAGATTSSFSTTLTPRLSEQERLELEQHKQRILLANAASAAFYSDCLVQASAGTARRYVQARGLLPQTVRTFAIGYAPDAYYNNKRGSASNTYDSWGQGSLVHHLKDLGFSPQELLDAGLATRIQNTNKANMFSIVEQQQQQHQRVVVEEKEAGERGGGQNPLNDTANNVTDTTLDYSSLMDRFRGRLIIPILDATGKQVLAFGGRTLPQDNDDKTIKKKDGESAASSIFEGPKYLNSPESLVFHKQNVLFGEHQAREAIRKAANAAAVSSVVPSPAATGIEVILVEGYMDAIALWTVGVETVVASMGTALSKNQLDLVARIASAAMAQGGGKNTGGGAGRVIICLDSDDAGVAAVERICSNGMLQEMTEKNAVQVLIASLPDGVKDPADFIDTYQSATPTEEPMNVAEKFNLEVLNKAKDWVKWYVGRIISGYIQSAQRGQTGSFSNIFGRVAEFLAKSLDVADRARTAYQVAGSLAELLAKETKASEVSDALRSQLESDLLDQTSRIASTKEAIQRRTEAVIGSTQGVRASILALSRGEGLSGVGNEDMLSSAAKREQGGVIWKPMNGNRDWRPSSKRATTKKTIGKRRFKERSPPTPLTPHFSGFQFADKSVSDWLCLSESPLLLGAVDGYSAQQTTSKFRRRKNDLVYFGSNLWHGNQFLTADAENAGYRRGNVQRDPSLLDKGIVSLVQPDIDMLALHAEDALLKALVGNKFARTALKNILDARSLVGAEIDIEWSCREKCWLLLRLVEDSNMMLESFQSPDELHSFLSHLWDGFPINGMNGAAFNDDDMESSVDDHNMAKTNSTEQLKWDVLDPFFFDDDGEGGSGEVDEVVQEHDQTQWELFVKQHYETLLWASTVRRIRGLEEHWNNATRTLALVSEKKNSTLLRPPTQNGASDDDDNLLVVLEQEEMFLQKERTRLASDLCDMGRTLQSLASSAKRLTSKLIDSSSASGPEGRLCPRLREDLVSELDDFVSNFKPNIESGSPELDGGRGYNDFNEDDEVTREEFLERTKSEWGALYDDDFVWTHPNNELGHTHLAGHKTWNSSSTDSFYVEHDEEEEDEESLRQSLDEIEQNWAAWEKLRASGK